MYTHPVANISPRDTSREITWHYVFADTETGPRYVPVSCYVLTRSEAFSHNTADISDEVEPILETPNHIFTSLPYTTSRK